MESRFCKICIARAITANTNPEGPTARPQKVQLTLSRHAAPAAPPPSPAAAFQPVSCHLRTENPSSGNKARLWRNFDRSASEIWSATNFVSPC